MDSRNDDDYLGLIFGYQNAKNFYAVLWKRRTQVLWTVDPFTAKATPNLHIKVCVSGSAQRMSAVYRTLLLVCCWGWCGVDCV